MTNFRAMCAELLEWAERTSSHYYKQADVIVRARALLAQPVAEGPTDQELLEMWHSSDWFDEGATLREFISIARAVLARWGNSQAILDSSPQPVPVSEGLPRPDDCDDEGYCWWWRTDEVGEWWEFLYLRDARDHNRRCGSARYTHWLPYHTIPNLPNPND